MPTLLAFPAWRDNPDLNLLYPAPRGAGWDVQGTTAYEIEGVLFAQGKTMQWLRDDLQLIHAAPDSEWYAGQVKSTDGVYLVPAFTGLSAPTWDPYARAAIIGISNATTRLHIIRAAVESMVYQTRDLVEAATADGSIKIPELRIDGGAVKNNLLCQMQADILGIPVIRPKNHEATIFGAMLLAGLSTGIYSSLDELQGMWAVERVFEPQLSRDEADGLYRRTELRSTGPRTPIPPGARGLLRVDESGGSGGTFDAEHRVQAVQKLIATTRTGEFTGPH